MSGWVGVGTQAQGWGQWDSGVQAGGPGSPKEEKQPGSNNGQLGAGQKSREYKHPCGSGVLGRAGGRSERASGREALQEGNAHFTR